MHLDFLPHGIEFYWKSKLAKNFYILLDEIVKTLSDLETNIHLNFER